MIKVSNLAQKYGEYYVDESEFINLIKDLKSKREDVKVGSILWKILNGYACIKCTTNSSAIEFVNFAYSNGFEWKGSSKSTTHFNYVDSPIYYFLNKNGYIDYSSYVESSLEGVKYEIYSVKELKADYASSEIKSKSLKEKVKSLFIGNK